MIIKVSVQCILVPAITMLLDAEANLAVHTLSDLVFSDYAGKRDTTNNCRHAVGSPSETIMAILIVDPALFTEKGIEQGSRQAAKARKQPIGVCLPTQGAPPVSLSTRPTTLAWILQCIDRHGRF